jgi:Fur family transcriptional regulator, ferric uptake regulator
MSSFDLGDVSVSLSPVERFEEFLQSRGMRITQPRRAIVDEVFSRHEHFDAEELLVRLQQQGGEKRRVSRATVYRTLSELVNAGLLRQMNLNTRTVYEHDYGYPQHDHLYCAKCEKLIEFHSPQLDEIRDAVAQEHSFVVTGHRFIITGICEDCRRRPARRDPRLNHV